jgi:hypothetical protein
MRNNDKLRMHLEQFTEARQLRADRAMIERINNVDGSLTLVLKLVRDLQARVDQLEGQTK